MCLYPKLIRNPKYRINKKNQGNVPTPTDQRALYVPIGCGKCMECRKQKARQWQVRLSEEIKHHKAVFITLSLSDESIQKLYEETGIEEGNAMATLCVKRFRERWRKKYKKSIKHWLVTELGQTNTERIHLHGFLFIEDEQVKDIEKIWQYGNIFAGSYVNQKTVNYCVKYVSKIDEKHKNFQQVVLTSPGIGKDYVYEPNAKLNQFNEEKTDTTYKLPNGYKTNLPIYYRNKLYSEEQREKLWMHLLDKNERWVDGICVKADDWKTYNLMLTEAQKKNKRLGYGDDSKNWKKADYSASLTLLKKINPIKYKNL